MSTSITVVCYKSKKLSNGNSPLMLRITKDRKLKYLSLGISIETHFWDFERNKPKANCPNKDLINKVILKKISEYNEKVIEKAANDEEYTATSLVEESKKRIQAKTVEDFYQEMISTLKTKGNIGNSYAYLNSYNTLKNFNKGKKLLYTFSHINTTFLKELEEWMREKGNKDTTLSYQFRTLRTTFNKFRTIRIIQQLQKHIADCYEHINPIGINAPILISQKGTVYSVQRINILLKETKKKYKLKVKNFSCHSLINTFGQQVYNLNAENRELALIKLMELFNHSSVAITKRYLGLRQEEIMETYDCLCF